MITPHPFPQTNVAPAWFHRSADGWDTPVAEDDCAQIWWVGMHWNAKMTRYDLWFQTVKLISCAYTDCNTSSHRSPFAGVLWSLGHQGCRDFRHWCYRPPGNREIVGTTYVVCTNRFAQKPTQPRKGKSSGIQRPVGQSFWYAGGNPTLRGNSDYLESRRGVNVLRNEPECKVNDLKYWRH